MSAPLNLPTDSVLESPRVVSSIAPPTRLATSDTTLNRVQDNLIRGIQTILRLVVSRSEWNALVTVLGPLQILKVGAGVPDAALGQDGNYYFRVDTPAVANQRIYVKASGAWTGIV
jgi:hypothetical protein